MPTGSSINAFQPTAWRMPVAQNLHFTGRQSEIAELRQRLTQADVVSRAQVLCGPAGIGKTQVAAEYARQFRSSYGIIWWINADSDVNVDFGLVELAQTLGLAHRDSRHSEVRQALFDHLATREDWLLIYDGAPDPQALHGLWPSQRTGHILVTSRTPNWSQVAKPFPVGLFERWHSVDFLLRRTNRNEAPATAERLAKALGDLPLALDQAASLIEQTRITFDDYLTRFETRWAELLAAGRPSVDYPMSVTMSWELSFAQVEEQYPRAAEMLAICSFLSSDDIPRRLLRAMAQFAPPNVGSMLSDTVLGGQAIGQLVSFSLIDADDRSIRLHPLAAGLARHRLSKEDHVMWLGVAVRAMDAAFTFDSANAGSWRELGELLPHALSAAAHADRAGVSPPAVRSIYNSAGQYELTIARFDQARPLLERALAIALELWGPNSPRISPIANNLGRVYLRTGGVADALAHFERAVGLDERVYGSYHPHVAEVINNRGVCLHMLRDTEAAEADFRRALEIYEMQFKDGDAKIASIRNNLGVSFVRRQDYDGAREQFESALAMARATAGTRHPTVAAILRNLGEVHQIEGRVRDAAQCFEEAVAIDEHLFGIHHPTTGNDYAGLATAIEALGDMQRAKYLLERAIDTETSRSDRDVDHLIERYTALARIHRNLDEIEEARKCVQEINWLKSAVRATVAIDASAPLSVHQRYDDEDDGRSPQLEGAEAL